MFKTQAVILAGGKSKRMGRDKSFVHINQKPLIRWVIETIQGTNLFQDTVIIGPHLSPYRWLQDIFPSVGPLGGIYTALKNCPSIYSHIIVFAVDMPIISHNVVHEIFDAIKASPNATIALSKSYFPIAIPNSLTYKNLSLKIILSSKKKSIGSFLEQAATLTIDTKFYKTLVNINSPSQLIQLEKDYHEDSLFKL